jgi:AcrR family transcriptional regulator
MAEGGGLVRLPPERTADAPGARPLRADAARNREKVLQAARQAFAESGYGVPLDEIASRAGVGPGTVYRHFPSKEALFEAVVTARCARTCSPRSICCCAAPSKQARSGPGS